MAKTDEVYWKKKRLRDRTRRKMEEQGYVVLPTAAEKARPSKSSLRARGAAGPQVDLVCLSEEDTVLIRAVDKRLGRKEEDQIRKLPRTKTTRIQVWIWKRYAQEPEIVSVA